MKIFFVLGVRQEQDIYVRLIDSVTKQVIMNKEIYYALYNHKMYIYRNRIKNQKTTIDLFKSFKR